MLFLWGDDCVSENHAEKIIISTFVKNHFIFIFIKTFFENFIHKYCNYIISSFLLSLPAIFPNLLSDSCFPFIYNWDMYVRTYTHTYTHMLLNLSVSLVCKCVEAYYLELGPIREIDPGKKWFSPVRSYWLTVTPHLGVVSFEIFTIYTGMTIYK